MVTTRIARYWVTTIFLVVTASADDDSVRKNWFNDPFFQVTRGVENCPEPRGPRMTKAEMQGAGHSRAEFGTTCWLSGKCEKPNSYHYDAGIADALRARFERGDRFGDTSLWVWTRGRVVWIEGCARGDVDEREIESFVKAVPDVRFVVVNVTRGPRAKPAYPVAQPGVDR